MARFELRHCQSPEQLEGILPPLDVLRDEPVRGKADDAGQEVRHDQQPGITLRQMKQMALRLFGNPAQV